MNIGAIDLSRHHEPQNLSDRFALGCVKLLRFVADTFFAKRYGHRAIVLETVAAVPGMVSGALQHLGSLRRMSDDNPACCWTDGYLERCRCFFHQSYSFPRL